jgi:hypothetical protein
MPPCLHFRRCVGPTHGRTLMVGIALTPANFSFPCRHPLAALAAFSPPHDLSAPGSPGVDDAKPLAAALAATKPALFVFGLLGLSFQVHRHVLRFGYR